MKFVVALILLTLTYSCSSDKTYERVSSEQDNLLRLSEETIYNPKELSEEARDILEQIEDGYIFKAATKYDKDTITRILSTIDSNLINLARENNIKSSIKRIDLSIVEYQSVILLKRDKPVIAPFIAKVEYINYVFAKRYNIEISTPMGSAILPFNFDGKSLAPYSIFSITEDAPKWTAGAYRDDKYAMIRTQGGTHETWLVSNKYIFDDNSIPLSMKLKQIVNGLDRFESIKLKISTNFDGQDIAKANWKEYSLKDPNYILGDNGWRQYRSPKIDLSEYQNKVVSFAFVLKTSEQDNFTWEILGFDIIGLGKTPIQKPYFNVVSDITFNNINDFTQDTLEGNPVKFYQAGDSIEINGFRKKQTGINLAYFNNIIDLRSINKPMIELKSSINYYPTPLQEREFIRVLALKKEDVDLHENYISLDITNGNKVIIPEELKGQEILIAFYYQHEHFVNDDGKDIYNTPKWNLSGLSVYELEP